MLYVYAFLGIIFFIVFISIPFVITSERQRKRKIEETFRGRQELDEHSFYEKYFEVQGVPFFIVKKIREILENVLDADLSHLSAEDDFSKNLNFFWQGDSLAEVEIFENIEEEFGIKFSQTDFEKLETLTITDLTNLTWGKVLEKENV